MPRPAAQPQISRAGSRVPVSAGHVAHHHQPGCGPAIRSRCGSMSSARRHWGHAHDHTALVLEVGQRVRDGGMFLVGRDDLVAGLPVEAREAQVDAIGCVAGERDLVRLRAEQRRHAAPGLVDGGAEVALAGNAGSLEVRGRFQVGGQCRLGHQAVSAGIQVGDFLQDGNAANCGRVERVRKCVEHSESLLSRF